MANVTVLGASGTISVPFKSSINQTFAQQLANQISTAVSSGKLTQSPSGSTVGGGTENEFAITTGGGSFTLDNTFAAAVNSSTGAVTISAGSAPIAPVSVLAGTGGTTFFGGTSTVGGTIALGGGTNIVAASSGYNGAQDGTNGGLQGNWVISSGAASGSANDIYLATGTDTLYIGGGDTIHAGGASVTAVVVNTDSTDPTFFIGSASSTVYGAASSDVNILGQGATGGGVYLLGTGGNGVIAAGAGNSTLVGGGDGDTLYASTAAGAQAIMYAGLGAETLQASYEGGSSTLYGGAGDDVLAGGKGDDVIAAGAGKDTIYTGLGADSVWFYAPESKAVTDTIYGFDPTQATLVLAGYNGYTVTSTGSAPLTITLSDSSTITFASLTTSQASSLKITTI